MMQIMTSLDFAKTFWMSFLGPVTPRGSIIVFYGYLTKGICQFVCHNLHASDRDR